MPTVDAGGQRLGYSEAGSGVPLVFVPNLTGSKDWFQYQISGLSDRYRVISYNQRRAVRGRRYNLDTLSDDLAKFLTKMRLREAVIAGDGLGALVAARFAAANPDRCLALVMMSASPSFSDIPDNELSAALAPGDVKIEGFFEKLWKRITRQWSEPAASAGALDYLVSHNADIDAATLAARLAILRDADISDILPSIVPPTLIIAGSLDRREILTGSQILHQQIDGSALEVIENADRYCFYTRHDIFNAILDEFLSHRVSAP